MPGTLESVAHRFYVQRDELAEEMALRIRDGVGEFGELAPELWEAIRASCLANIEAGMNALGGELELPERMRPEARELALLTARLDLPLAVLLRAYRVGHAMMWERLFDAIEAEDLDDDERREVTRTVSAFLFGYVDRVGDFLTAEYTAERDRSVRSREQRRTQLVRDVLDGADPDPALALAELDYDLRLEHLACVVAGSDPEVAVRSLARQLEASHMLLVSLSGDTTWAWLGRVRPFTLPERIAQPDGAVVSVGDPAVGIEGFRRSHREAREAHAVALRRSESGAVVSYDAVALEALLAADEGRARAFAARELEGIDGADQRSVRLRETLRAYFACGQNASAAAAVLGVHEHTVTYRLRSAEDRLGRPVAARRAELELALRVLELDRG
jgi:hypothetical protein